MYRNIFVKCNRHNKIKCIKISFNTDDIFDYE